MRASGEYHIEFGASIRRFFCFGLPRVVFLQLDERIIRSVFFLNNQPRTHAWPVLYLKAKRGSNLSFMHFYSLIQIFPGSAAPSRSAALLMVAPQNPLPAVGLTPSSCPLLFPPASNISAFRFVFMYESGVLENSRPTGLR